MPVRQRSSSWARRMRLCAQRAGLDYLSSPSGAIAEAQQLAARLFGCDATWFLVNGCSVAIHAAVLAVAGPGDTLLVARNCHLSAFSAMVLAGEGGLPMRATGLLGTRVPDTHTYLYCIEAPMRELRVVVVISMAPAGLPACACAMTLPFSCWQE